MKKAMKKTAKNGMKAASKAMTKSAAAKKAGKSPAKGSKERDIIALILEHHKPLKDLLEKLKSEELEQGEKRRVFQEFAPLLLTHAEPEEKTLYVRMKDNEELRTEGFEGDVEHKLAVQMIDDVVNTEDPDEWMAKVKVLAELVEHHIEEEEGEMFADVKKELSLEERVELGVEYLRLYEQAEMENDGDETRFQLTAENMLRADP